MKKRQKQKISKLPISENGDKSCSGSESTITEKLVKLDSCITLLLLIRNIIQNKSYK